MRRICATCVLLLMSFEVGCYSVIPTQSFPPPSGAEVNLGLTAEGTQNMAAILGPRVNAVQGRYLNVQSDSVYVAVSTVYLMNGDSNFWEHERIGIPRPYVANVGLRKISATRSALLAAAFVGGLAAIRGLVANGNPGTTKTPPPIGQ